MLPWKRRRALAQPELKSKTDASPGREASTLLAFLAGEFAAEVAHLWPAPHTEFVTAPAARRQLVFLSLALQRGAEGWTAGAAFARQALDAPLKSAIRELAPGAPPGLARALGRIGETAWPADDYVRLLRRLADERTAKVLWHAETIAPRDVRVLSTLPSLLIEAGGILVRLTESQTELVGECFGGILARDGEAAAHEIAARWSRAPSPGALFRMVACDIRPIAAEPPFPGTRRLVPLATRDALDSAARRYRNCLEGRSLDGWVHYYEWVEGQGAVISITHDDLFGWRLDEALGPGNEPLSPEVRDAIRAELVSMGVHVGRSAWALQCLAREAAQANFQLPPREAAVAEAFEV